MRAVIWLLVLFIGGLGTAHADNSIWQRSTLNHVLKRGQLRVCMEPGYAPFEMKNKKGELVGFDVDIARLMADAMGVKLALVELDWSGIMPALLTDQCDLIMSGMTITSERNLWINFADPYMTVGQTVLLRKGLARKIKRVQDLNHDTFTVVTKPGVTAHDAVKKFLPRAKLHLFGTEREAAMEVVMGRADAFIYDMPFNAIYHARNPDKVALLDHPFTTEFLGWGLRKGDVDFLSWLNHFLRQIKADGSYDAVHKRWFVNSAWQVEMP